MCVYVFNDSDDDGLHTYITLLSHHSCVVLYNANAEVKSGDGAACVCLLMLVIVVMMMMMVV